MPAKEGVSREQLSEHRILLPQVNFLTVSLKLQNLQLAKSLQKKKKVDSSSINLFFQNLIQNPGLE